MRIYTTLKRIRDINPCETRMKDLIRRIGGDSIYPETCHIDLLDAMAVGVPLPFVFLVLGTVPEDQQAYVKNLLIDFACDCAERVLPIYERERTGDTRPRAAIENVRSSRSRDKTCAKSGAEYNEIHMAAYDAITYPVEDIVFGIAHDSINDATYNVDITSCSGVDAANLAACAAAYASNTGYASSRAEVAYAAYTTAFAAANAVFKDAQNPDKALYHSYAAYTAALAAVNTTSKKAKEEEEAWQRNRLTEYLLRRDGMSEAEAPSVAAILECPLLWRMWTRKMDAADEKRRRESIQRSSESLLKLVIIGTRKEKES